MKSDFEKIGENTYKTNFDFSYEADELTVKESFKYHNIYNNLNVILDSLNRTVMKYRVCDAFMDYLERSKLSLATDKITRVFFKFGEETRELEVAKLPTGKIVLS